MVTRVNSASIAGSGTAGPVTVTIPAGTGIQAGDLIIACCVGNGTHVANGMTVKDSVNGVNYTSLLETDESSASSYYQNTKYYQTPVNIADGSTFTFTPFAACVACGVSIDIFRGLTGTIDKAAVGASPVAGTSIPCPALGSAATAGSLVLSMATGGGAYTLTQSTMTTGSVNTASRNCGIAFNLSADGVSTYANTWTQGTSSSCAGQTVSFTAAATGGPGFTNGIYLVGAPGVGVRSTTGTVTGAYSQPPKAGNQLVAIVIGGGTTGQTISFSQASGSAFTYGGLVGRNSATAAVTQIEYWTRVATGGETPPVFNVFTTAPSGAVVIIFELFNPNATPIDVSGTYASGTTAATIATLNGLLTTSGNIAASNEFGLACWCFTNNSVAATATWTKGGSYTHAYDDGSVSSRTHMAIDYIHNPTAAAALSENCSITSFTGYGCGLILAFKQGTVSYPLGQISAVGNTAISSATGLTSIASFNAQNAGDLIVAATKVGSGTINVTGISDSAGVTTGWTRIGGPFVDSGSHTQEIWIGTVVTTLTTPTLTTLNFTFSGTITSVLNDIDVQEFTTGYNNSTWSADGASASQNNATSTTITWPSLTAAAAGELYLARARVVAGGYYTISAAGFVSVRDANNNPLIYNTNAGPGAVAPTSTDSVSATSAPLANLIKWAGVVTGIAGSSASVSSASGTLGNFGVLVGSSASVSSANGTVVLIASVSGSSPSASSATGAIAATMAIAGSAPAVSSASGTLGLNAVITGSSSSVSAANGNIAALLTTAGSSSTISHANGTLTPIIVAGSSATASAASGAITTISAVAGSSSTASSAAGTITATLALSGSSATVSHANGAISLLGVIAGSSATVSSATGAVTAILVTSGSSATASSASGAFGLLAAVSGTSATASAASGSIVSIGAISGSSSTPSLASGNVAISGGAQTYIVAGSSATASAGSGAVTMTLALSGSSMTVSSASGVLGLRGVVAGSSATASAAAGTAVLIAVVSGQSAATSSASGSISKLGAITGSSASASSASGAITIVAGGVTYAVAGSSATASSASGSFGLLGAISGLSVTASSAAGTVTLRAVIAGVSVTVSGASGTLGLTGLLAGTSATSSGASGRVVTVLRVAGLSVTLSQADGVINPPFVAGELPPGVEAIVYVSSALVATVSTAQPPAVVMTVTVEATVYVDVDEATITTDQIKAEVT